VECRVSLLNAEASVYEEPCAGIPHAGICAGGAPKGAFLPRWSEKMMTEEQKYQSLLAPQIPLRFLFSPQQRERSMHQFSSPVTESGAFFRLWDLTCALREPEVQVLLDTPTEESYTRFQQCFDSLPWKPLEGEFAHIQQIPDEDLVILKEPARDLSKQLSRCAWKLMPFPEKIRRVIYRLTHWKD